MADLLHPTLMPTANFAQEAVHAVQTPTEAVSHPHDGSKCPLFRDAEGKSEAWAGPHAIVGIVVIMRGDK